MEVDAHAAAICGEDQCGEIGYGEGGGEIGKGPVITAPTDPRDRFTLQAEREFRASPRPIYRNSARKPRPVHVASCLLLNIDGVPIICTAAHVADHSKEHDLYVGGVVGGHPIHIPRGSFISTLAPGGNRDADHFDYAFWEPPSLNAVARLGGVEFLNVSEIARDFEATQTRLYTSMGYARSRNKNKINHACCRPRSARDSGHRPLSHRPVALCYPSIVIGPIASAA